MAGIIYQSTGLQLSPDRRPSFDLYGTFGASELNMEDLASLAGTFRSDGKLYVSRDYRSGKQENSHVTLREDSSWVSGTTCPAMPK
jgi:hypothetical protein